MIYILLQDNGFMGLASIPRRAIPRKWRRAEFTRKPRLVSRPVNAGSMKPSSSGNFQLFRKSYTTFRCVLNLDV